MGKPGAYLTYGRSEHGVRAPEESCCDFNEIAIERDADTLREQASRCMNCGVAFCQTGIAFGHARPSGCPLHNLIPEFNDLVYRGRMDEATERLVLTNPFADFTGRVCPAPCEAACNLGLNFEATTIRDNERAIADYAWECEQGPVTYGRPRGDAPSVAVIGSGPAGLAVAAGLGQRGIQVTVFERDERPGGLLTFGIPNMKLPKEVVARRIKLMEDAGCTFRLSTDVTEPEVAAGIADEFDAVVLATGARRARGLTCEGANL
jgi:glutamate synthase (NADPH/NADH) small chain